MKPATIHRIGQMQQEMFRMAAHISQVGLELERLVLSDPNLLSEPDIAIPEVNPKKRGKLRRKYKFKKEGYKCDYCSLKFPTPALKGSHTLHEHKDRRRKRPG